MTTRSYAGRLAAIAVAVLSLACFLCPSHAIAAEPSTQPFRNHGVAARVSEARGVLAARDARDRPVVVAMPMDKFAGGLRTSLLLIDVETGKAEQFWHPRKDAASGSPYHLLLSSNNRLYTTFGKTFVEFDLARREWTFSGTVSGDAMSLAEGPDGTVYVGTYPSCDLYAFDPKTRELRDVARIDSQEKYPSFLAAGSDGDGWVYAGVGTARANVVALDPATGERTQLIDEGERVVGTGVVRPGTDGVVYGRLSPKSPWLKLENGTASKVAAPAAEAPRGNQRWQEVRTRFPGGGEIRDFDLATRTFTFLNADGGTRRITFDYESAGASIASLAAGPDGRVYACTSHPMQLAVVDAADGSLKNLGGIRRVGGGNFPAMAALDGRLYAAAYSSGDAFEYDPAKPWTGAEGDDPNPRGVANFRPHLERPRGALTHSDGRHVVFGGFPGYGHVGGGLLVYDVQAREQTGLTAADDLRPGHSPVTLAELPGGDLVIGTSVSTPGGGRQAAKAAELLVFDWNTRALRSHLAVDGAREIVTVLAGGQSGHVYAVTRESNLVVFDRAANAIVHRADLTQLGTPANAGHRMLMRADDGRVVLVLSGAIATIEPRTHAVRVLATPPVPVTAAGAVEGRRVYFGSDASVWSYELPAAAEN